MDQSLLFLLLLLMGRQVLCQPKEVCLKTVINSCDDCIRSGPYCVWCQDLNFTKSGKQEAARCDTKAQLIEKGCKDIIFPTNSLTINKDEQLADSFIQQEPIQLRPQKITMRLRPGLPQTFKVSFKRVQGYPVDLYYLMDLSYSMKDDLEKVKELGQELFAALKEITKHGQIGFGAFVDKTVLPYTNTNKKKLQKPCDDEDEQKCQPAFGYRHVLPLTPDINKFKEKVSQQFISGNLDSPEGSLDAMMQAAVCGDKIGWRNSSTRLIILTTDAGFHMAGDGKLAGILEPNDEQCHMEDSLYTKSSEMDYPSVGQLATQLEKNNIQPIFAVTENVAPVYEQLSAMMPKSEVGVLLSDSKNVVQLIKNAYESLSSKVTVTHDNLPDDVHIVYNPICDKPVKGRDSEGICDDVHEKQEISFNITVTAFSCLEGEKSFTIRPLGIKDTLTVSLSTECACKCQDPTDRNHGHCNGKGRVNCGICSCHDGFMGQFCNCATDNKDDSSHRASCQRQDGTECTGRGDCVCGRCQCHTTESGNSYRGDFCECDDEHCEKFQNKLCGGKGRCNCGICECFPGYEGSACQCLVSEEGCRTVNNTVCYGRGTCKCNRCECDEGYQPLRCEECLGCPDPCSTKLNCIECLGFDSGPFQKNCSVACKGIIYHEMVEQFTISKEPCRLKDSQSCWIEFSLEQLVGKDNYRAEVLMKRDCPEPPSVIPIIAGSIAAVALIGILLLMLIKGLIFFSDLKEFRKFENDKKKSKWAEADNPLFQNATTTVANPTFTGE